MIFPLTIQTVEDVSGHYDELDTAYREIWGEHVHHGYWRAGRETPTEATEALIDLVADQLDLRDGQAVCDIGCGYGGTARYLASRHRVAVTGFTISGVQARFAQSLANGDGSVTFVHRDWLENGLPDGSFERAYAIESSEHMIDKARFFTEAARVLKPGGRLVVCAWLSRSNPTDMEVRHLLEPICREGRLPSMGDREDYAGLASNAGLVPVSFDDIGLDVRRTWSICARRFMLKLFTDGHYRRLAFSRSTRNRSFVLSVPRLMIALRTGAMRYGVFVWDKPATGPETNLLRGGQ